MPMPAADQAMVDLGRELLRQGYHFTTITPESHRRINARPENERAKDLPGVFGWSRPFHQALLPQHFLSLMQAADCLTPEGDGLFRSRVRFSSLGAQLFVHSSYPTDQQEAVFFGPDSYRFVTLLRKEVSSARRVVDVGAGSGVGGLSLCDRASEVVLSDVNPAALRFSHINAGINRYTEATRLEICRSDVLNQVSGTADLIVANPPYLSDELERTYRSGGQHGHELSIRIVREALSKLEPGGRLILYTATPVQDGRDLLRADLDSVLPASATVRYQELDPDVFGEELDRPAYRNVERIALVSCIITTHREIR